MNPIVKNQHYIPQSILKNFSNDNGRVFEVLLSTKKIYSTAYRQSMCEKFTYEHPFFETNFLEKQFGEIESYFAPAMRKIITILESTDLIFEELKRQAELYIKEILIFYYRSGALLNEFTFDTKNKEDKVLMMLEKIWDSEYLTSLSETIKKYYKFSVIKTTDNNFLLSDQYISTSALSIKGQYSNISNRHIGLKDVIILIPLSSSYYIVYYNGSKPHYIQPNKVNILSIEETKEINTTIFNNSYIKCISHNKVMLQEIISDFIFGSPSRTIMLYESGLTTTALNKKEVFFYKEDRDQWDFFKELKHTKNIGTKRNDICKCGSGKKYKKCCLSKSERNYYIVSNMHKPDHHSKIKAGTGAQIEKSLEEYNYYTITNS